MGAKGIGGGARSERSAALKACLAHAMQESPGMISRWVSGVLESLKQQEAWAPGPMQRSELSRARQCLSQGGQVIAENWTVNWSSAISEALRNAATSGSSRRSLANISFEDLELMDESQVQATVQAARLEQEAQGTTGDVLVELTALISRAQGYPHSRPEHNPLRPDVALKALRVTMDRVTQDPGVRSIWLQHGTALMGQELQVLYRALTGLLAQHGVTPADYKVIQAPVSQGVQYSDGPVRLRPAGVAELEHAEWSGKPGEPADFVPSGLLTLDSLHGLLMASPHASGAPGDSSSRADGGGRAGSTLHIPVSNRHAKGVTAVEPSAVAEPAGASAGGSAADNPLQALAVEVVSLMLSGISRDGRLLAPVRTVLRRLEPALHRIAREDPRFFVDKENPARRLLDEMTQRSLAFQSEQAPGFAEFLASLEDVLPLLARTDVRLSSLFETALDVLARPVSGEELVPGGHDRAVASLVQAEQRYLVAKRIADELSQRRDFTLAHEAVQEFLMGPWSQVIAHAQMDPSGRVAHGRTRGALPADMRYLGVVSDLIWSSRVGAASRNRNRLARVIPGVLRTLREGLQTVEYDPALSRQFLGVLMGLHAAALRAQPDARPPSHESAVPPPPVAAAERGSQDRPWIKPGEASDSGFMDTEFYPDPDNRTVAALNKVREEAVAAFALAQAAAQVEPVPALEVGAWIELRRESGEWVRLQLDWKSPHGLMYLFASKGGRTSSMSRRAFEDMYRDDRIRLVAAHSVVDDALSRVLDVATLNSARASDPAGPPTVYPDLLPPIS